MTMRAQDHAPNAPATGWLDLGPGWLFASIRDAVVVAAADSGHIALWNPAAAELFGFAADEVVGSPLADLVHDLDQTSQWLAATTSSAARQAVELFARRKSGPEVCVELTLSRLENAADGRVYVLAVVRDTSERHQHEEERIDNIRAQVARDESAAAQRRLAVLAEASRLLDASLDYEATLQEVARVAVRTLADWCIVHLLDPDGAIRSLALAHGDPAKEALARQLQARYPATEGVARVLRTGISEAYNQTGSEESSESQRAARAHDAEHLRLLRELDSRSVMIVPLTARGRVLGALSVISTQPDRSYDPTDLAIAEELARRCGQAVDNARLHQEAQAAVKARDRFVSIASHELRTPIARVKGYAEMVLAAHSDGDLTEEMLQRSLKRIDHASDRLAALVRDLLDVSKISAGTMPMRLRPVDVTELVRDVVSRYQEQLKLGDSSGHLLLDIVGNPRQIAADPDRIEQVLTNLLENALKYSPDGAELRVRVQPKARGVLIEVQDHGIGLPPQAAERVFEPFSRAANAEQLQITGMGLGLFICRNIIEQHKGRIWARSAGEGQGTLMSVWLPDQATHASSATSTSGGSSSVAAAA
jgi:PAS domain S-box-containing protein